jgi:putative lumazine-binding protein
MKDYAAEYNAIVATMQRYFEGGRAGKSDLMRAAFHPDATIVGYCGGSLLTGPIQQLFAWIDGNGPAPDIDPCIVSIEVIQTVAVVRVEVSHWSGKLAGAEARMSDAFTLLKTEAGWKISSKTFHWHTL